MGTLGAGTFSVVTFSVDVLVRGRLVRGCWVEALPCFLIAPYVSPNLCNICFPMILLLAFNHRAVRKQRLVFFTFFYDVV